MQLLLQKLYGVGVTNSALPPWAQDQLMQAALEFSEGEWSSMPILTLLMRFADFYLIGSMLLSMFTVKLSCKIISKLWYFLCLRSKVAYRIQAWLHNVSWRNPLGRAFLPEHMDIPCMLDTKILQAVRRLSLENQNLKRNVLRTPKKLLKTETNPTLNRLLVSFALDAPFLAIDRARDTLIPSITRMECSLDRDLQEEVMVRYSDYLAARHMLCRALHLNPGSILDQVPTLLVDSTLTHENIQNGRRNFKWAELMNYFADTNGDDDYGPLSTSRGERSAIFPDPDPDVNESIIRI